MLRRPRDFIFYVGLRLAGRISKELNLIRCKSRNVDDVQTVCLAIGPYRNLTTLTASILFLHPHCQVLNHGGLRVFGDRRLDFLAEYSDQRFETFIRYAIQISGYGRRGYYGGSVTRSHAFGQGHTIKDLLGPEQKLLKDDIRALFWKESFRTSKRIRNCRVDLGELFARNQRLRFLMPVRNPLDCAVSHLRTGYVRKFRPIGLDANSPPEDVVAAILEELLWVEDLRVQHPDRFFVFFEHEFNHQTVVRLAEFLRLEPQADWCQKALDAYRLKPGYEHPPSLLDFYRREVETKFARHPSFAGNLLKFLGEPAVDPRASQPAQAREGCPEEPSQASTQASGSNRD